MKHHRRSARLSAGDIDLVARAAFSTSGWLKRFGSPYYGVSSSSALAYRCQEGLLPHGWRAFNLGLRHYIFFTGEKAPPKSPALLTPAKLRLLRRAAGRGIKYGEQRIYAARFGVSESYFSRLLHRERFGSQEIEPKEPPARAWSGVIRITPVKVERVFGVLLTVRDWIDSVGSREYGINDASYVYQMCSRRPNGPSKSPTRLPAGWGAVRVGESWLIYKESSVRTEKRIPAQAPTSDLGSKRRS